MRLAAKLILLYLFGLALIVGVFTYLTIENQRRTAAIAHGQQASHLVAAIRPLIERALAAGDEEMVREHLRAASRELSTATLRYISPSKGVVITRTRTVIHQTPTGDRMVSKVPILYQNQHAGMIEIDSVDAVAEENLRQSVTTAAWSLLSVTLFSSVVIFLGGWYLVGRPLNELIHRVELIAEGQFEPPANLACCRRLGGRDELGQLGRAIDSMRGRLLANRQQIESETATRIAAQKQLYHADRLGTVGRLAAGVAHEVGTPLAVVSGRAELIADGSLDNESVRQSAGIIKEQSDRIAAIVRQLLGFARPDEQNTKRHDISIGEVVNETVRLVDPILSRRKIAVATSGSDSTVIQADGSQIQQVFTNMFSNAVDAGAKNIEVRWSEKETTVEIQVIDDGNGMDAETVEHLFEPFFTTKDVGSGTGLGMSISYGIIEEHGGRMDVQSVPKVDKESAGQDDPSLSRQPDDGGLMTLQKSGTTFTIEIPKQR